MLFIIRSVITLDGFAGRMAPPFNALELAYPHALRRALTPTTKKGQDSLVTLVLTKEGDLNIDRLGTLFSENNDRSEAAAAAARKKNRAEEEEKPREEMIMMMEMDTTMKEGGGKAQEKTNIDTMKGLLASPDGIALRRILYQLNTERLLGRVLGYISPLPFKRQSNLDYRISHIVRELIRNQVLLATKWGEGENSHEAVWRRGSNSRSRVGGRVKTSSISSSSMGGSKVIVGASSATSGANSVSASNSALIAPAAVDTKCTPEEKERRWKRVQKVITRAHIKRCFSNPKVLTDLYLYCRRDL